MSKNVGQVAGLFIGTSAPTNTTLIWYDSASHVHKVYNSSLGAWTVLDQSAISSVTYSELVNRAATTGLTQGQWFKITDRSNALALAITSTKVQYADNSGALVINDLGTNIQYHVTSGNLLIDDISGVYNTSTGKLVFSFEEGDPIMDTNTTNVDYILGVSKRGTTRSLKKWKFSKLLSANANNDISWSSGFFLNFGAKLRSYFDVTGGVVSQATFDTFQQTQQQTIAQLAEDELAAIQQISQTVVDATAPTQIYGKALPTAPTSGVATPIVQGDTLYQIITKIQRWIDQLRYATGIKVSSNFTPNPTAAPISNTDSVDLALRKTQKNITILQNTDYSGETQKVGTTNVVVPTSNPSDITKNDTIKQAIQKLIYWVRNITTDQIVDKAVTERKMGLGTYPTDICRLDIEVSFPTGISAETLILTNTSVGFCLLAGQYGPFRYDSTDANNPYRLSTGLIVAGSKDYPIISFAPVLAPQNNTEHDFSIAAPMLHYTGHWVESDWEEEPPYQVGAYFQSQILLSQTIYDALYNAGMRYIKVTINSVDVYGNTSISVAQQKIEMNRVNIWGFPLTVAQLQAGSNRHMIVKITISFSED